MSSATSRTSNKRPAANAQASENANQRKKTEGMTFQRFVDNTNVLNLDIIASHVANTPQSDAQAEHAPLSPPMQTEQSPVAPISPQTVARSDSTSRVELPQTAPESHAMTRIRSRIAQLSSRAQSSIAREAVFQRFFVDGSLFAFAVSGNTWPLRTVLAGAWFEFVSLMIYSDNVCTT